MRGKDTVIIEETIPTHFTQVNPSMVFDWTSGNLDYIEKTMDGVTYRKTFTWDVSDNLTAIGAWIEI